MQEILVRTSDAGWPHPSLCGEAGLAERNHDERIQTGILTSGFTSLPPSRPSMRMTAQWHLGVCNLLQWRNRSGFSPDSLTFDCEIDELAFTVFKERFSFKRIVKLCQELFENFWSKYTFQSLAPIDFRPRRLHLSMDDQQPSST